MRLPKYKGLAYPGSIRRWQGHIDSDANGKIVGWAMDKTIPATPVEVVAVAANGKKLVTLANTYREDLERAGHGNGRHGFTLDLSSWSETEGAITISIAGSGHALNTQPLIVTSLIDRQDEGADVGDEASRWRGHVDKFDRNFIKGWAVDVKNPYCRIQVEAVSRTGRRVSACANGFRGDLNGMGFGDGYHGFEIDVRALGSTDCPMDVVINHGKIRINRQPLDFDIMTMMAEFKLPGSVRSLLGAAAQAVIDDDGRVGGGSPPVGASSRTDSNSRVGSTISAASRTLFATAQPGADLEGLISKFMRYESFRCEREKHELLMDGPLQDRMQVVMWYLVKYLRDRGRRFLLPLSTSQQRFLNGPVPLAGYPPEVTIALFNFVRAERPEFNNLEDPAILRQALFWWCCERAPSDKLDRGLTTKAMATFLTREEQWIGEDFPFNVFMAMYFNTHQELHTLDMNWVLDRAAFTIYLVIRSFTEPYIARFLPRDMLRTLLANKNGSIRFDDVVTRLIGQSGIDGGALRRKGEALLAAHGISLSRAPTYEVQDIGEGLIERSDFSGAPDSGVALIGPLHKTSGLGQATRLSLETLKLCEVTTPTTLSFDLDNPAPVGFASALSSEVFIRPREINLIHLNAESVPLAFTFEQQDIFARSYNIGYFFWELNMIPKCHHLALELLDEVWVSSEYNREIYARYTDKPVVNVGMAVESLPTVEPIERSVYSLERDATIFLSTFDSFSFIERKNPMGVLDAFQLAFPRGDEPVQLVLKTQNRGRVFDAYQIALWRRIDRAVSADARIIIINETLPYRDVLGLKLACDCYVSLHRSEGWGFGMLEAMNLERPVIATAYSGNMDFCTPETTYLVDYDLIGVREQEYIFVERGSVWSQPCLAQAAERMREVVADPVAARAKGMAGAVHVRTNFSTEAIARRYGARLANIRARLDSGHGKN